MIEHPPAEEKAQRVEGHQGLQPGGSSECEEGEEDYLKVGVRVDSGEHAEHSHDRPTGPQTVGACLPAPHLVHHGGEGGEDSGTEVDSQELLLAQLVHCGAHEAVQADHVAAKVDQGVVGEGGKDHGQAGGGRGRVACEPLDHRGLQTWHSPGSEDQEVQPGNRPKQLFSISLCLPPLPHMLSKIPSFPPSLRTPPIRLRASKCSISLIFILPNGTSAYTAA